MSAALPLPHRAVIFDDPEIHYWGEFFVKAGLYPFLRFDEFVRDPEAFVRALTDPAAPAPKSMPCLRERITAHVRWHRWPDSGRVILIQGETR